MRGKGRSSKSQSPKKGKGPKRGPSRSPVPSPSKGDIIPQGHRLVMGIHSVKEAFQVRPRAIESLWLRQNYHDSSELLEFASQAEDLRIPIQIKSADTLNRMTSGHQGLAVLVSESPELDWDQLEEASPQQVLILDGVEDPHNLGAILRTSWLMGVRAIFIPEVRAVGLTPTTCKVASGGAEHVPVVFESSLPQLVERLKSFDFWVYGLAAEGRQGLWDLKLDTKVAWALGSEDKGLRKPLARSCDELVHIPQASTAASYNVSVAGAMAMGEAARQFHSGTRSLPTT